MKRRRFLAAIVLVAIMSFAPVAPASAQDGKALGETLSTSERSDFVNEVTQGCLENQRTAPENKGVSEAIMAAYCRCTAEQMVAQFNAAEVERIIEDITPELQARVDRIEQACVPKAK